MLSDRSTETLEQIKTRQPNLVSRLGVGDSRLILASQFESINLQEYIKHISTLMKERAILLDSRRDINHESRKAIQGFHALFNAALSLAAIGDTNLTTIGPRSDRRRTESLEFEPRNPNKYSLGYYVNREPNKVLTSLILPIHQQLPAKPMRWYQRWLGRTSTAQETTPRLQFTYDLQEQLVSVRYHEGTPAERMVGIQILNDYLTDLPSDYFQSSPQVPTQEQRPESTSFGTVL